MGNPDTPGSDRRPASLKRLEAITGTSFGRTQGQASVYLVLDYSGSMSEGSKMQQAKDGAREFAEKAFESGYAAGLVQLGCDEIEAPAGKSERVDQSFFSGVAEDARPWIAGLWPLRNGPTRHVAESECRQRRQEHAVFVVPGRQANRIRKLQPSESHRRAAHRPSEQGRNRGAASS